MWLCKLVKDQSSKQKAQYKSASFPEGTTKLYIFCLIPGPFVMNTQKEIQQAIADYRGAKNGFENAKSWESDYVKSR